MTPELLKESKTKLPFTPIPTLTCLSFYDCVCESVVEVDNLYFLTLSKVPIQDLTLGDLGIQSFVLIGKVTLNSLSIYAHQPSSAVVTMLYQFYDTGSLCALGGWREGRQCQFSLVTFHLCSRPSYKALILAQGTPSTWTLHPKQNHYTSHSNDYRLKKGFKNDHSWDYLLLFVQMLGKSLLFKLN